MSIYSDVFYSPNFGYPKGSPGRGGHKIIGVGVHISGAEWQSNYSWIMNPAANASYNAIIRRDGRIINLVPESNAAYAHGRVRSPNWPLLKQGVNPNLYTLSVARVGSNQNTWDKPQMDSMVRLIRYWANKYNFKPEWPHVFGHKHIDSVGRLYCPGDPFLNALQEKLGEGQGPYFVVVGVYTNIEAAQKKVTAIKRLAPNMNPEVRPATTTSGRQVYGVVAVEHDRRDLAVAARDWLINRGIDAQIKDSPAPPPDKPEKPAPPIDEDVFYRVIVGSYNDRSNADRRLAEAKEKGFSDAFIVAFRRT